MTTLDQIVNVTISRETTAVSRAAFNVPMFLATHTAFSDRVKEYASTDEVAGDFGSTTAVYIAASKLFGQEIRPPKILIGRRQVNEVTVSIGTLSNSTAYTLTINGTIVSYTSDSSATNNEIIAGLNSAFSGASITGVTFTNNNNGTAGIAVNTAGTAWSIKSSANLSMTNTTPTETYVDAVNAIQQVNDTWYALTFESHLEADILAMASAIEAKKKIYFTSSSDSTVKTSSTSDIASQLKALGYTRTSIQYSADAANYPECAWVGGQLPKTPGSNTWKFKSLQGNAVDLLSSTESTYIKNKNCNRYETVGGVNIMEEGVVASGEFIDVIIFIDWMESRIKERIYSRLVNLDKVPLTRAGMSILEAEIRAVMSEGIRSGGLSDTPAPTVTMPDPVTMDPNLKALRTVEGISFVATLAGAVHAVFIQGRILL